MNGDAIVIGLSLRGCWKRDELNGVASLCKTKSTTLEIHG